MTSHIILPVLQIYRSAACFSLSLENQLDWDKRRALNVVHTHMWIIECLHSKQSLQAHSLQGWAGKYRQDAQNCWPRKQSSSMTVGGNSLRRNLWKIPFEGNRTWQLSALVVKSVGRKAWPAMSDPCQAVWGWGSSQTFQHTGHN